MYVWILYIWIGAFYLSSILLVGCLFSWVSGRLGAQLPDAPQPRPADIEFRRAIFFPSIIMFSASALSAVAVIMIAWFFENTLSKENLEALSLGLFVTMFPPVLVTTVYSVPKIIVAWKWASHRA